MRLVVADATPLHYLILIDSANVLPTLFQTIHLPIQVRDELTCDTAPESVRKWFQHPPDWLEIHNPPLPARDEPALSALHAGERAAILLAQFLSAKLLLIDDRA